MNDNQSLLPVDQAGPSMAPLLRASWVTSLAAAASSASLCECTPAVQAKLDEANALYSAQLPADTSYLERVIAVGCRLRQAEEIGGDVPSLMEQNRRGRMSFSGSSARRFLSLARHAPAIRAANLTTVKAAEALAGKLDWTDYQKETESAAEAKRDSAAAAVRYEGQIFNKMRSFPQGIQRSFLIDIIGRLNRLDHLCETPVSN